MAAKLPSIVKPIADWWSQRTHAQRFGLLTALLIAVGAIVQGLIFVGVASHIVDRFASDHVERRLDKAATQLAARVNEFRSIPLTLSDTPPVERIVALSTGATPQAGESLETWRQQLGIILRSIVEQNPGLMQVRLIDAADGRELVRVDRTGDTIEIIAKEGLKRRSSHPYFIEIAKLRSGEVYLSPIEPINAQGVAERPPEPTIWAGTPIFTEQGQLFGFAVVNASADAWLKDALKSSVVFGRLFVANRNGDYIFRSDHAPTGSGQRFLGDWPQLGALFNRLGQETSVRDGHHYLAARRIEHNPKDANDFVVLAADADSGAIFGNPRLLALLGASVVLTMAAVSALAAYFVARPLKGLTKAAKQIAAGHLNAEAITTTDQSGELGTALRIMKEAIGSREASLRRSEAQLQALVDNTIDGLITIDRSGTILRYNHGCEEIFGYSLSEALGRNVSLLLPSARTRLYENYLKRYAQAGRPRFVGRRREIKGRHKSGCLIDLEIAIAEIKVEHEVLFSGIVRDITERKRMERIKSEFISTVTHELRTPLTSIMGALGLLRSGALGALPEKPQRMIVLAHDNGKRLVDLINNILDIDSIDAGHFEVTQRSESLKALIEQAAEQTAAHAAQHGVILGVDAIPGDIILDTDRDRFHQVLGNLLSNAVKFSPRGGEVRLSAEMAGDWVRISVTDRGPGIPESFRKRIFDRFTQADSSDAREKGGTGLGLSVAKAVVERLGGEMGYETEIGVGTRFYFALPARRAASEEMVPERRGATPSAMQRA